MVVDELKSCYYCMGMNGYTFANWLKVYNFACMLCCELSLVIERVWWPISYQHKASTEATRKPQHVWFRRKICWVNFFFWQCVRITACIYDSTSRMLTLWNLDQICFSRCARIKVCIYESISRVWLCEIYTNVFFFFAGVKGWQYVFLRRLGCCLLWNLRHVFFSRCVRIKVCISESTMLLSLWKPTPTSFFFFGYFKSRSYQGLLFQYLFLLLLRAFLFFKSLFLLSTQTMSTENNIPVHTAVHIYVLKNNAAATNWTSQLELNM
jgi:hypothetical protein